jgi:SAM-dependent methyltransferase
MPTLRRVADILKYSLGPKAKQRKRAEQARVRAERFLDAGRWQHGEEFAWRRYASYDEYVAHQAAKLDGIVHRLRENEAEAFVTFKQRFATCAPLAEARSVLCLGARLGTEVRALHALGYFAVGIDLSPGSGNAYVLPGDFHRIVFPGNSVDAIYTNALDHAFALERIVGEVRRLLRPGGLFIIDLIPGCREGFIPGEFEAMSWSDSNALIRLVRDVGAFTPVEIRDLGRSGRFEWRQAVLRKPAA